MASKTFSLGEGTDSGTGSCGKFCMVLCCLLILGVIIAAAVYAYKSNVAGGGSSGGGCPVPKLDENGLSNWTSGAEVIAYACLPNFFLEGDSNVMFANCENDQWTPSPPACNYLPLRLDCDVDYKGIRGNVSVWQANQTEPVFIYGLVNYTDAPRQEGHILNIVQISKGSCQVSNEVDSVKDMFPNESEFPDSKLIQIDYNTTAIKAYNKAEIHITLIFIDKLTTASLVSVHQGNLTLIMSSTIPTRSLAKKYLTQEEYELSAD